MITKEQVAAWKKEYDALPESEKKVLQEKRDFMMSVIPCALAARASKGTDLVAILSLGEHGEQYCKRFNVSILEFMSELRAFERALVQVSIESGGVHFDDTAHHVPDGLKKKNRENKKRMEETEKPSTASIGDMLKAKVS